MGALVLPDRLNEGQFQDVKASSLPRSRSQKSTGFENLVPFRTEEISSRKQKSEDAPKRQKLEEISSGTQKSEDAPKRPKLEDVDELLSIPPDGWTKSLEVSGVTHEDTRAVLSPDSWIVQILSGGNEDTEAITLLNCLRKEVFQKCDLWFEPPVSPFGHKTWLGLGILTLPERKEKDSRQHGGSVSKCNIMSWKWLGLQSMPWHEVVKGSQPGLDDVLRIAPCKFDDFHSDSTSHKMMLGGFFSKTSRNIHLYEGGQTLCALCRNLEGKWRLAMLELTTVLDLLLRWRCDAVVTLSTSGVVLKVAEFKLYLDDHIANDDGTLVIRGGFFSRTSRSITFEDGILRALCEDTQGYLQQAVMDLDQYITNNDGTLQSREKDEQFEVTFMSSCHSIRLLNTTELHGYARCRDLSWKPFRVNLDYNVKNQNGHLVWLASPPQLNSEARASPLFKASSYSMTTVRGIRNEATSGKIKRIVLETSTPYIDDGFVWRKYGEKSIKGRLHPRSYFKCAETNCSVKKQTESSSDRPGFVLITYFGTHNHPRL